MAQNWNNLIYYINSELGAPSNKLELTDAEMQTNITNLVMPEFSAYVAKNMLYKLDSSMQITATGSNSSYQLPLVAAGIEIITVREAYYSTASAGNTAALNASAGATTDPTSILTSTITSDVYNYMTPIRSYIFNHPDIIVFNQKLLSTSIILDLDVVHVNPNSIPSDLYHKSFKKQALLSIIEAIIAIRSKYTTVQTPFGEVGLNIDELRTKGDRLRDEIKEVLNDIPPQELISFVI